jgi:DNA recombination protein RmuC
MVVFLVVLVGILAAVVVFMLMTQMQKNKRVDTEINSISSLDPSALELIKSVINAEVTTAAQAAMQQTNEGTQQFFKANTETLTEQTKNLLNPMETELTNLKEVIAKLQTAHNSTSGQVNNLNQQLTDLNSSTSRMVGALQSPVSRGKWGENSLRNIIELAGMSPYADFVTQTSGQVDGKVGIPDVVIRLPNDSSLAIDAKAPGSAYEQMVGSESPDEQSRLLQAHIAAMKQHIKTLAGKAYWNQFEHSPEFVVMFVPLESMLSDALRAAPTLLEEAMKDKIILASPMNLLAVLKATFHGWQVFHIQKEAKTVGDLAQTLYRRIDTMLGHVAKAGRGLESANKAHNEMIGSLEKMVLPTMRELNELNIVSEPPKELEITQTPIRPLNVPELSEYDEDESQD